MPRFAQRPKGPLTTVVPKPRIFEREGLARNRAADSIHHLQRTIGNQALAGMRQNHISKRGDRDEQAADRAADRAMRLRERPVGSPKTAHQHSLMPSPLVRTVTRDAGRPLDSATRAFMEARFGHDFSRVRVHTGTTAERSARDLNARAYTTGDRIVFGAGEYAPGTDRGNHLLAHELAHVIQQQAMPDAHSRIQRYEGPEHQDLGDKYVESLFDFIQTPEGKQWAAAHKINALQLAQDMANDPARKNKKIRVRPGLELTPGQIISLMGDFYGSLAPFETANADRFWASAWQQLKNAPKDEIDKILAVMEQERAGTAKNANAQYEKITKGRYTALARKNSPHFAPKNKEAWKALHVQAIELAKQSRQASAPSADDMFQEALGMDAAGGHFLTDAYSAGHLMDSIKVQAEIQNYLMSNPIPASPEMKTVTAGIQYFGLAVSLTLKNIHDRMNAEGFEVTNAQGMKWKTFGDNHLKNAVETQRIAAYAVFLSRQQITRARNGDSPNPDDVLAVMPDAATIESATKQAIAYIPEAVREISTLIKNNLGMLDTVKVPWYFGGPALPFVGKSVLGTISDPGRNRQLEEYDRRKQIDPNTPYPTPPLLRWDF